MDRIEKITSAVWNAYAATVCQPMSAFGLPKFDQLDDDQIRAMLAAARAADSEPAPETPAAVARAVGHVSISCPARPRGPVPGVIHAMSMNDAGQPDKCVRCGRESISDDLCDWCEVAMMTDEEIDSELRDEGIDVDATMSSIGKALNERAKSMNEKLEILETAIEYNLRHPEHMHPGARHVLQFFNWEHLPEHLQLVSRPFAELAGQVACLPQNAETTVALRKLLEAKDCAVRSVLSEGGK